MKKKFDAVAFMRKQREELSRAYSDLSVQQIEEHLQKAMKDNPLWKENNQKQESTAGTKKTVDRP
ncbi:MAG: hypothetical protein ACYTE3_19525 [Planctomycetota bacterium]|jgi:hypothetical protein